MSSVELFKTMTLKDWKEALLLELNEDLEDAWDGDFEGWGEPGLYCPSPELIKLWKLGKDLFGQDIVDNTQDELVEQLRPEDAELEDDEDREDS